MINLAQWLDFLVLSEALGPATSAAVASSTPVAALSAPVAAKLSSATMASTAIATSLVGSALLSAPATAAAASLAFIASRFHAHRLLSCLYQERGHSVSANPVQVNRIGPNFFSVVLEIRPWAYNPEVS